MLLVQLCLSFLLGMLGPLASAPRVRNGGGWYAWSGVLLTAWLCGVSGLLVMRFPDWAVFYLFEAMGHSPFPIVLGGAVLSLLAAVLGMRLIVPLLTAGPVWRAVLLTLLVAAGCVAVLILSRDRLSVVATTLEYRKSLARPLTRVAGFQGRFGLVLIGALVPCVGSLLLLLLDSARPRRAGTPD